MSPEALALAYALDVVLRRSPERARRVLLRRRPGLCLINNPHNPSGALMTRDEVEAILATTRRLAATLVVDEAFVDYAPEESIVDEVREGGLVVVRSLSKFYAIPGARIGYAVASKDLAGALESQVPSWPSGRLDVAAALAALETVDTEKTRRENRIERERPKRDSGAPVCKRFPRGRTSCSSGSPSTCPRGKTCSPGS